MNTAHSDWKSKLKKIDNLRREGLSIQLATLRLGVSHTLYHKWVKMAAEAGVKRNTKGLRLH